MNHIIFSATAPLIYSVNHIEWTKTERTWRFTWSS